MLLTIPKLRTWHLLGIVATCAAFMAVFQFRWTVEDDGYALIRRLRSADAVERTKAANELRAIRPVERRAIGPLTEMLFDTDARARAAAAGTLFHLSSGSPTNPVDEAVVGPLKAALVQALGDRDPVARLEIARTLGYLGTEPKIIVPVLLEFAQDQDARRRADAVSVLGNYARQSEPSLAAVFAGLKDGEQLVRDSAIRALTYSALYPKIAPGPFLERINTMLLGMSDDPNPSARLSAIAALRMTSQTDDPRMVRFLSDPDAEIRAGACSYVIWRQPKKRALEFVPALERTLHDPILNVRQSAAHALGWFGLDAEPTLPALRALAQDSSEDAELRKIVASSMATIENRVERFRSQTLPQAIGNLAHDDPAVRSLAAFELEGFGPKAAGAVPSLVKCLGDREADVRRAAASALGQLGPKAAVALPDLANLAESDPDEPVRQAARVSRAILLPRDQAAGPPR